MDLQARADRRFRIFTFAVLLSVVLAGALGFAAGAGAWTGRSALIVGAVLFGLVALMGGAMALMMRYARRRTGTAVSPLWGADRKTRQRAVRAVKDQEEPAGELGRLALAEANRSLKLAPVVTVLMVIAATLALAGAALQLADGDLGRAALAAVPVPLWIAVAVQQLIFRRRARAYLARYGSAG
ncbi:hypothetical protein AB0F81_41065 [Actinoplanes sp. NPDC024001]|uniref:hypothetical protein n=1 Tax=Actinoplanes sp. NPDC024001 TaxID=3154598 RepID=UPI0033E2D402